MEEHIGSISIEYVNDEEIYLHFFIDESEMASVKTDKDGAHLNLEYAFFISVMFASIDEWPWCEPRKHHRSFQDIMSQVKLEHIHPYEVYEELVFDLPPKEVSIEYTIATKVRISMKYFSELVAEFLGERELVILAGRPAEERRDLDLLWHQTLANLRLAESIVQQTTANRTAGKKGVKDCKPKTVPAQEHGISE